MVKTSCTFSNLHIISRLSIFLLFAFFSSLQIQNVSAANITLSPASGTATVGKTFSIDVKITNNQDPINAVSSVLSFPANLLEVVSISKSGSLINTWAEDPKFSNQDGSASFEGVILNPGFTGTTAKAVTVTFKAKAAGSAAISLKTGQVLANDGNATNVLGTLGSATFTITDSVPVITPVEIVAQKEVTPIKVTSATVPVIISSTYPNNALWYSSRDASFSWSLPSSVTAVRTLYDEKESSSPSKVYDPAIDNRSFSVDGDGVMYMHVQFKTSAGWSTVAHYKFQIDTKAPENLKATFPDGATTTNPTPAVLVTADDTLSGLDHITMSVDDGEITTYPIDSSNLYHLPKQNSGKHTVLITVYDKAGNKNDLSANYTLQTIAVPTITNYTKRIEQGGVLTISGTTYPETLVEVALTNQEGKVVSEKVTSNEKGDFTLTWEGKLPTGIYEMRARAIDAKGAMSDFSDTRVITLENVALIRIGMFIMNWLSLILIMIVAGFSILGTFWYSLLQFGRFKRKVHRTLAEVENALKINIQALRRDTEEFHSLLVKAEKKRELTKEEQSILKKFKKRLEVTEKEIEKKLEAIG
ncbi:MAG: hypothetical protein WC444_00860 [Candidatus Paceibacterota bacterium]